MAAAYSGSHRASRSEPLEVGGGSAYRRPDDARLEDLVDVDVDIVLLGNDHAWRWRDPEIIVARLRLECQLAKFGVPCRLLAAECGQAQQDAGIRVNDGHGCGGELLPGHVVPTPGLPGSGRSRSLPILRIARARSRMRPAMSSRPGGRQNRHRLIRRRPT